jgi:murein DD-endopeptidase MepM/ murein hydrolase activator NlpD
MEINLHPLSCHSMFFIVTLIMVILALLLSLFIPFRSQDDTLTLTQVTSPSSLESLTTQLEKVADSNVQKVSQPGAAEQPGFDQDQAGLFPCAATQAYEGMDCIQCEPLGLPVKCDPAFVTCRFHDPFAPGHLGLDIAVPLYTEIYATQDGQVRFAGDDPTYGYLVVVGNPYWETRYAHNAYLLVRPGDVVAQGDLLALSGNTGVSSGDHLHYEIRDALGNHRNPESFLGADRDHIQFLSCAVETTLSPEEN